MKDFKLDNGPRISSGFKAPEGYFESFTERMMEKLPVQEDIRVIPLFKRKPVWLSVAASAAILVGLSVYYTLNTTTTEQPDAAAIENYLVYQANMNSYELMQLLDQQDINELEQSIAVNEEAIEDYLNYENIYLYE